MGNTESTEIEIHEEPRVRIRRKYTCRRDWYDPRDKHVIHPSGSLEKTKSNPNVDLRPFCPPVWDQGNLGSCTAHGIAAAYVFDVLKQKEGPFDPSCLFLYYNERKMEGTVTSDAGGSIRDGIYSLHDVGICSCDSWPYDISKFADAPPAWTYDEAKNHHSLVYKRVDNDINNDINMLSIRTCLRKGFPIVFGFTVYPSFETDTVARTGQMVMPSPNEKPLGGHCVMMVGYDDKKKKILVRNSWGVKWGEHGYFWMPYEFIQDPNYAFDFWTVEQVADIEKDIEKNKKQRVHFRNGCGCDEEDTDNEDDVLWDDVDEENACPY